MWLSQGPHRGASCTIEIAGAKFVASAARSLEYALRCEQNALAADTRGNPEEAALWRAAAERALVEAAKCEALGFK
jgi:hypothetical protein